MSQAHQDANSEVSKLTTEIGNLKTEIKGFKDDLTDKDRKALGQDRRTETYLNKRQQQGEYNTTTGTAAKIGAVLGTTIGSIVAPGIGSAIGGALGGVIAGRLSNMIGKNPKIQKLRRERRGIGKISPDRRNFDRDLQSAKYKKDKQNK